MKLTKYEELTLDMHTKLVSVLKQVDGFVAFYVVIGILISSALLFLMLGPDIILFHLILFVFSASSLIACGPVCGHHNKIERKAKLVCLIATASTASIVSLYYIGWAVIDVSMWL